MNSTKNGPIPPPDEVQVEHAQVIVVGAGPVGLFLALKMVKAGINVLILEAEKGIVQSPRATTQVSTITQDLSSSS